MAGKRPKTSFWIVLATVNIASIYYSVNLLDVTSEAACVPSPLVLIATMLVLSLSDAISVLIAYGCWSELVATILSEGNSASGDKASTATELKVRSANDEPALDRRVQCH